MGDDGYPVDAWAMENFANAYRNWLCYTMNADNYHILFDVLYDTEFVWVLPEDERRAASGRYLRERFEEECGLRCEDDWVEWPCSFLEMLIGLAYSMESILYDPTQQTGADLWFWVMMNNIGLAGMDDETMLASPQKLYREINAICRQVCYRTYDKNGNGGLFPLRSPVEDQRSTEIWCQMQAYILENVAF